jgi:hypothetical protein
MRYELAAWLVPQDDPTAEPSVQRCRHHADCEHGARRLALEQAHDTGVFILSFIFVKELKPTTQEGDFHETE